MVKSNSKNDDTFQLANITTYQSGVVQSSAMRKLNRVTADFLSQYNLTTMEWFIIGTIYDTGKEGVSLTTLKNKLGTTMPYITTSVKTLVTKDILIKSPHTQDNRTKIVAVSSSYRPVCLKIEKELRARLRQLLYDKITPEETRVYVSVLYKISSL